MMKRKQSEIYTKILKAFMVGTLACGLVGCAASDNEPKVGKEENTEKQQETKNVIPTEIMSKEETMELTEGTTIELKDLKKMPDEATLDEMELMMIYNIKITACDSNGKPLDEGVVAPLGVLPENMKYTGIAEEKKDPYIERLELLNITIKPITYYYVNENDVLIKIYEGEGEYIEGSPIVSEKILKEYGKPQ